MSWDSKVRSRVIALVEVGRQQRQLTECMRPTRQTVPSLKDRGPRLRRQSTNRNILPRDRCRYYPP